MATKRVGWGALLNSVKDKKQKKDEETSQQDAPPAKKLKSEITTKKEEKKVVEKKEEKKKEEKVPKKEEKVNEGDKKITKKVEKTPKKEEKAEKKATKETEVKAEKKTGEKGGKKSEVKPEKKNEEKKDEVKPEKKEAKGEKKRKDREANNTKPTTNEKQATTKSKSETKDKTNSTKQNKQKTEQEEKQEKHQLAKDAVRLALKDRHFYDFAKEEPIVVYLHAEKKEGEHNFYLDLLAKSYLSNFSDSVSFKKTKLVLGFDVEFYNGLALTIQLSTASFSIVFNLYSSITRKTELSPGLQHIFSSADYIKCGVGVPADMITLQGQFKIALTGMFDISWFVLDMGLTPGLWSLDTLGHDILDIGKVNRFGAKSYELSKSQIQYAARDGWLGYALTEYLFDFFKQSNASMYSWAKAYVKKKDDALIRAVGEEKPFSGEQIDKNEKDENEKDDNEENENEENEKDENEKDENEKDENEKDKDSKDKDSKDKDSKDKKGAPKKGVRRSNASIESTTTTLSRHIIRNKLEAIKETRRKANREEENFNNLIQQLSKRKEVENAKRQKTKEEGEEATQTKEEEEDVQVGAVLYNWV